MPESYHIIDQTSSSTLETTVLDNSEQQKQEPVRENEDDGEHELHKLLLPDVRHLPLSSPSAVESNFVSYFAPDFMKPEHDQHVYRHANGLRVIGLASTHIAFKDKGGITAVDFNVGKSDRSGINVTGKRKKISVFVQVEYVLLQNAQHFESNTALCKVCTSDASYIAEREGYIAIIMPKPADWLKVKASLLGLEEYRKLRSLC